MNINDMTSGQSEGQEPLEQLLRDVCELATETVGRITDAEVNTRLQRLLNKAGYSSEIALEPDPPSPLRGARHEAAEILAAAQQTADELAARAVCAAESAEAARRQAQRTITDAEQFADAALDRAASIIADARKKAESIIVRAEKDAQDILTAARVEADRISTQARPRQFWGADLLQQGRTDLMPVMREESGLAVRNQAADALTGSWTELDPPPSLVFRHPLDALTRALTEALTEALTRALTEALARLRLFPSLDLLVQSVHDESDLAVHLDAVDALTVFDERTWLYQAKRLRPVPVVLDDAATPVRLVKRWRSMFMHRPGTTQFARILVPSDLCHCRDDKDIQISGHGSMTAKTYSRAGTWTYTSTTESDEAALRLPGPGMLIQQIALPVGKSAESKEKTGEATREQSETSQGHGECSSCRRRLSSPPSQQRDRVIPM